MVKLRVGDRYISGRIWFQVVHIYGNYVTVSWCGRDDRNVLIAVVREWLQTGQWVLLTPTLTDTTSADADETPCV